MFRYLLALAMILSLCALAPVSSFAQTQTKQEKKAAKVKDKLQKLGTGEKAKIKVKTYGGVTYQGYVSAANADDFTVTDKGGTAHGVRYADVDKIGGKNLSTGAKIGIGIAIGAAAVIGILAALLFSEY
jgi:hypothetical protein